MYSQLDNFRSSYDRSFGRRNIVDRPLENIYFNKDVQKDLQIPIFREKYSSTYESSFGYKNPEAVNYHRRSSINSERNLKRLHEEYSGNPVKPLQNNTTSATVHRKLELPFSTSATCVQRRKNIPRSKKDNDFFISTDENSFQKLLDIYATTNQLTHRDFSSNGNRISNNRKKIDGENRKYQFNPVEKTLYRRLPKQFARLTNSGNISNYMRDYGQTLSNNFEFVYDFPAFSKLTNSDILTVPGMYSTESSHLGSERPIRSVV